MIFIVWTVMIIAKSYMIKILRNLCMYRNMGVSSTPLGVSGREDGVNQHKGANNLSSQSNSGAVPIAKWVGSAAVLDVVALLESLHQRNTGYGPQRLSHHVQHSSHQRHLPSQEKPKCHRRVNVTSCSAKVTKPIVKKKNSFFNIYACRRKIPQNPH